MSVNLSKDCAEDILREMTVEEKAALITGGLPYGTAANERLGIPNALLNDSMAGINFRQLFADYCAMETGENILVSLRRCEKILQQLRETHEIHPEELDDTAMVAYEAIKKHLNGNVEQTYQVTSFPAGNLLGSTWNPQMVFRCAEALAREFDVFGVDVILTPNVNIQRDPLGGRLFESYSEDPYLTAELGAAFVRGIQETGILADPKHFAVNNHEKERKGINVHVQERALREIYFPGFEACVKQGGAKTFMSAYNKINGTACSANGELLTKLLREEWGFDGIVISDWGGVYDSVEAIKAGNDLEMPQIDNRSEVLKALKDCRLSMEELDLTVLRILKCLKEMPCVKGHRYYEIDTQHSQEAAYRAIAEGIVLLKNQEQVLPLKIDASVNMVGEGVHTLLECGGGSAEVLRKRSESLYECMRAKAGVSAIENWEEIETSDADYVVLVGKSRGQEGVDRAAMLLDQEDQEFVVHTLKKAKEEGKKTILILNIAGPVDMREYEAYADAVLCVFIPGCQGNRALADVIYGDVNPSGKLAITFPKKYEDCPTFGNFPGYNASVWYGEGIYVGYRYYDTKQLEPAYPFGYGLSYTRFSIHDLKLEKNIFEEENIRFSVDVTNEGDRDGKEVIQVYIHQNRPFLQKPQKELKAFKKIEIPANETRTAFFELSPRQLASYDEKLQAFVTEPGIFSSQVGTSSRNIQVEAEIAFRGADHYGYGEQTRIASIWSDERCREIYRKYFEDKCSIDMYNDLLGYTPDYPVGKALRERIPAEAYASPREKDENISAFFDELARIDLGKLDF